MPRVHRMRVDFAQTFVSGILAGHLRKIHTGRHLGSVMKYLFDIAARKRLSLKRPKPMSQYAGPHGMTKDYTRFPLITRDDSFACRNPVPFIGLAGIGPS